MNVDPMLVIGIIISVVAYYLYDGPSKPRGWRW